MPFKKATKFDSRARIALSGPSGAGKTWTALTFATALSDGASIAVVDTERGSASKYADRFQFDVMELDTFHPQRFIDAIHEAEQGGYAVLVIDSLSHAWNGTGGLLEIVDQIAKRKQSPNTFTAWKGATPIQNALVDAITRSSMHIIVTMRSKQEYVLEKDERTNKTAPRKVGMAPIQRDGLEYEFDITGDLDIDNTLIIQKTRCDALNGLVIAKPTGAVMDVVKAWLQGEGPAPAREDADPTEVNAVRVLVGQTFAFKSEHFEDRWRAYKQHVLGRAPSDPALSTGDLIALRAYAEGEASKPPRKKDAA